MNIRHIPITLLLSLAWTLRCFGQPPVDPALLDLFTPPEKDSLSSYSTPLAEATSEISILASTGFLIYKTFISSQDRPSCVFTPSCSEYALQSVQEKGFILGWLNTFDRLSRCHGFVHHEHYEFDIQKMRYHDAVE